LTDVIELHYALVQSGKHGDYHAQLYKALSYMTDFMNKTDAKFQIKDEMEGCFVFLYWVLLLRFQHKLLSQETGISREQIARLLALLSLKYRFYQQNELEL
jgi:hypothetical protein